MSVGSFSIVIPASSFLSAARSRVTLLHVASERAADQLQGLLTVPSSGSLDFLGYAAISIDENRKRYTGGSERAFDAKPEADEMSDGRIQRLKKINLIMMTKCVIFVKDANSKV